jgi:hypothetical protein
MAMMKHRVGIAGFVALVLGSSAQAANLAPATTPTISPEIAAQYVHPHELIDIGKGRKLNLFFVGNGSPTVIFDSGLSDWSVIWALVQPGVAAHRTFSEKLFAEANPSTVVPRAIVIV